MPPDISTIARTEFPALLIPEHTSAVEGRFDCSMRRQVSAPSKLPHQMELVCNKAFDHEIE